MADEGKNGNAVRRDPFGAYHFTLELDQEQIAYPFRSVSGLKQETAVVEVEEGGFNHNTHKLIGRTKFPNLVLKRGLCAPNTELYKLRQRFLNDLPNPSEGKGKHWQTPNRFGGVITVLGPRGSFAKWRFGGAWICKWESSDLDATKNEIVIETVEIAHEGLYLHAMKGVE
jgi:phage tail-like protein